MSELDDREVIAVPGGRAKPSPVGPVDARRIAVATTAVFAVAGLMIWAVRSLPAEGALRALVSLGLGLVIVPLVASPLEWFVHRFVYHEAAFRPLATIFTVHTAHHYTFFPTWRYITTGPARRLSIRKRNPDIHHSAVRNGLVRLAHFSWYMAIGAVVVWVPGWLLTHDVWFMAGAIASSAVVSNLFIVVHDTIHRPGSHRIVEAQPWYAFLDRHHYIHHVALGTNLNFLLPLADLLFGSLRTELAPDELDRHGPLDAAKRRPIGAGERARSATAA